MLRKITRFIILISKKAENKTMGSWADNYNANFVIYCT